MRRTLAWAAAVTGSEETASTPSRPQLSAVIPVYNEEAAVIGVVSRWAAELRRLGIDYELLVYDDGSKDDTGRLLRELAATTPELFVTSQPNRGHGPTILKGYREARGEWVFQTDGDGEIEPDHFEELWKRRDEYDFLLGSRQNRRLGLVRRFITLISRVTVWVLFGKGITDVNSPYRLMRRAWLQETLAYVRADAFAPNLVLSGCAVRSGLRIYERPVAYKGRRTGRVSIARWKLWRSAARAFLETVRSAFEMPRTR